MINVNIRYKGKELSTILPKCNDELRADLKKAGIDLPAEKLKLRSSAKEQYLVGLYTNNPLDDLIIDRLCNNDNLFELNNLCGILDNVADHDLIFKTILCSDARCINGIKKLFADHFMEFSDKLVLNTHLEEKPATFNVKKCVIEKAIAVTHKNFEHISRFPFMSLAFLERNKDTLEWQGAAPIFDSGTSLWYNKLTARIPASGIIYKPFKKTHGEQLKLASSLEWFEASKLDGIEDEILEVFSDDKAAQYIDTERAKTIAAEVRNRIETVASMAMSHTNKYDISSTEGDVEEDVAESYGMKME